MRRQEDYTPLFCMTGKKGFQLGRAPFINGSEGFIKNPQACATQIQSGQGNPSQLAGRELVARSFFVAVQTDLFEGGIDGGAGFRTTDSGVPAEIFEGTQRFLYPRQMPQIKQIVGIFPGHTGYWMPLPQYLTCVILVDASQRAQQGSLAAAVGTDNLDNVAGISRQIQAGEQLALVPLTGDLTQLQQGCGWRRECFRQSQV